MAQSASQRARHLADLNPPICSLKIASSFAKLTSQEKLYAHWMSRASWAGARIVMVRLDLTLDLLSQLVST